MSEPDRPLALGAAACSCSCVEGNGCYFFVNKIISKGYKIRFTEAPKPYCQKPIPIGDEDRAFAVEEIAKNLARGAWIRAAQKPEFCAAAFVVRSATGKRRVVIDLRYVNEHIFAKRFKYESLTSLKGFLRRDSHMISCDLQSGYHHIAMHEDSVP